MRNARKRLVAAGYQSACARRADSSLWCWGGPPFAGATPTQIAGLTNVAQVVMGVQHVCVRKTDSTVVCFGTNSSGQLGDGTTTARVGLITPVGLGTVSYIAAGWAHTCAIRTADARVYCWGSNSSGQLGDGTTTMRTVPTRVIGLP